jgi:hypothetical protein
MRVAAILQHAVLHTIDTLFCRVLGSAKQSEASGKVFFGDADACIVERITQFDNQAGSAIAFQDAQASLSGQLNVKTGCISGRWFVAGIAEGVFSGRHE